MGYQDMFGGAARRQFDNDEDRRRTAEEEEGLPAVTPLGRVDELLPELVPLRWEGFASGHPLLLERPSVYWNRIAGAGRALIVPPAEDDGNGGAEDRMLYSGILSVPFPVLYGTEGLTSEDAVSYPMLHQPENRAWDPDADDAPTLEEYALTMCVAYQVMNIMVEEGKDIVSYRIPLEGFDVDGDLWDSCAAWAKQNAEPLFKLNVGRLLTFGLNDIDAEEPYWQALVAMWGLEGDGDTILDEAKRAADILEPAYHAVFPDVRFEPFTE